MAQTVSTARVIKSYLLAVTMASAVCLIVGATLSATNQGPPSRIQEKPPKTAAEYFARMQGQPGVDTAAIRAVLDMQAATWNCGDIGTFMTGYWKSDKTEFVGASGIFRGWQAVLDRYRKTYPNREAMGQVRFSDVDVHLTSATTAFVVGQYHLQRQAGPVSGVFTLEFRKFADGWKIIVDHTTAFTTAVAAKAAH